MGVLADSLDRLKDIFHVDLIGFIRRARQKGYNRRLLRTGPAQENWKASWPTKIPKSEQRLLRTMGILAPALT